ncbi:MAG: hypothetical protein IT177_01585 [Acidobacteria bacterium]|nr:hypothetical protein [Acidobacteriota bacterium]
MNSSESATIDAGTLRSDVSSDTATALVEAEPVMTEATAAVSGRPAVALWLRLLAASTAADRAWRNALSDYWSADTVRTTAATNHASEQLFRELATEILSARDELFEDGVASQLGARLRGFFSRYPADDVTANLVAIIAGDEAPVEPSGEVLRLLSKIHDADTHATRLWLFERCLHSARATIRDSALLALENLEDPRALDSLEQALGREPIPVLRREIQRLITELRAGKDALPTP